MIKIENLNKFYNKGKENEIHVIHDVNLELPDKGLISFLGVSGSGKTTLLNVIGGLDKAKGTITYNDLMIKNYKMHDVDQFRSKEIGYVFQNYNLLLEETVYSNLKVALEMIGIYDKEEQEKRIEYTLKAVGMFKFRKKRAYALSGGQQQRVSIARALVKNSSIIIADEPTGNLDSENTIEVMNVLRKISKTSLVLMVTHNEEVANFYSDEVIRIKDGCIIDRYQNDGSQSLDTEFTNTIYLKDMDQQDLSNDAAEIHLYAKGKTPNLQLDIMYVNGTFYLRSNQTVKLAADSNIKVLNEHKISLNLEEIEKHEYDTSWFSTETSHQNPLKLFWHSIVESFNKIRFSRRRTKLLYIAFVFIGILLAACVVGYSNFTTIDDSSFVADSYYDQLYSESFIPYDYERDFLLTNLKYGKITDLECPIVYPVTLSRKMNLNEQMEATIDLNMISTADRKLSLVLGEKPKSGEIVISRKIADEIIKEYHRFFPSYEALVGETVTVSKPGYYFPSSLKISGIVNSTTQLNYIHDSDYLLHFKTIAPRKLSTIPVMNFRHWLVESKYQTYTIVGGRDLTEADRVSKNILIPSNYPNAEQYLSGIPFNQYSVTNKRPGELQVINSYNVVGLFELKDFETPTDEFIAYDSSTYSLSAVYDSHETYKYNPYVLVEGQEPIKIDECIVSIYSQYQVGDTLDNGAKVVGRYRALFNVLSYRVLYHRDFVILSTTSSCWFKIKNKSLYFPTSLNPADIMENSTSLTNQIRVVNTYDFLAIPLRSEHRVQQYVFGCASIGTLIVLSLFIYLMMRSKMISDISSIGIYRCLGKSRASIILQFLYDILLTVTLTSLLGFLIPMGLFDIFIYNFHNTLLVSVANHANGFIGYGVLALYVLNVIFGLLPIITLLRKTPAQIVAKYDI